MLTNIIIHLDWWGRPKGSVVVINAAALSRYQSIMQSATWKNLHRFCHNELLVYEVRIGIGYGMRWHQDRNEDENCPEPLEKHRQWIFRGFVEPIMENGHELRWKH